MDGGNDSQNNAECENDEANSDEEGVDVVDGKCIVDGVTAWVVEKITKMRYSTQKGYVEFYVTWEADKSETWEPLSSFSQGYDHRMIQDFKNEQPKLFERVMKQASTKTKDTPKSKKNWTYVNRDEDCYEKPDDTAAREARRLADPNRLEDKHEKFLLTYSGGERVSRSKARKIQENIWGSEEPSPVRTSSPPKQTKETKKRGRKRKEVNEATILSGDKNSSKEDTAVSPHRASNSRSEEIVEHINEKRELGGNEVEVKISAEKKVEGMEKLVKAPGPLIKKKRARKLNSSDSSEEEDDDESQRLKAKRFVKRKELPSTSTSQPERNEGGGDSRSIASEPTKTRTTFHKNENLEKPDQSIKNSKLVAPIQNYEVKKARKEVSSTVVEVKFPKVNLRAAKVRYNSDEEFEKDFSDLHIQVSCGPPVKKQASSRSCFSMNGKERSLNEAIENLDLVQMERLFKEKGPELSYREICMKNSLHEILTVTFESRKSQYDVGFLNGRYKALEKVFRLALTYLPEDILRREDNERNTLLHRAIHAQADQVVQFLIRMGSPLHITNSYKMTAVETCVAVRNLRLLAMLMRSGATFHHFLYEDVKPDSEFYKLHIHVVKQVGPKSEDNALNVAKYVKHQLDKACKLTRGPLIASQLVEQEHGPIVSFPRRNLMKDGSKQTIEFLISEKLLEHRKFMLVLMPVVWDQSKKMFHGATRVPSMHRPVLCGRSCTPMSTRKGTIFYHATNAINRHIRNSRTIGEKQTCSVTLDFNLGALYQFITCQLIAYTPTKRFRSVSGFHRPDNRYNRRGSYQHKNVPSYMRHNKSNK